MRAHLFPLPFVFILLLFSPAVLFSYLSQLLFAANSFSKRYVLYVLVSMFMQSPFESTHTYLRSLTIMSLIVTTAVGCHLLLSFVWCWHYSCTINVCCFCILHWRILHCCCKLRNSALDFVLMTSIWHVFPHFSLVRKKLRFHCCFHVLEKELNSD